jgi:hypothetical protein
MIQIFIVLFFCHSESKKTIDFKILITDWVYDVRAFESVNAVTIIVKQIAGFYIIFESSINNCIAKQLLLWPSLYNNGVCLIIVSISLKNSKTSTKLN